MASRLPISGLLQRAGRRLAGYLAAPRGSDLLVSPPEREALIRATLRPGDVLLVSGTSRFSEAVKYLTQSTWSHAALYVGEVLPAAADDRDPPVLVEADVSAGVRAVPLSMYTPYHTRICRPVGLDAGDVSAVTGYVLARLGQRYDLRNIVDLARYLIPRPPVPARWRRSMLALGSGDPTRAICSSLIAQAFQSVRYPILPYVDRCPELGTGGHDCGGERLYVRHHSLFAPRDFDLSPYFRILKPAVEQGFDHRRLAWQESAARAVTPAAPGEYARQGQ